jgi:hypothetical protein
VDVAMKLVQRKLDAIAAANILVFRVFRFQIDQADFCEIRYNDSSSKFV